MTILLKYIILLYGTPTRIFERKEKEAMLDNVLSAVSLENVRMIVVQFSFSNPNVIPKDLPQIAPETVEEFHKRKSRHSGTMIIRSTENCDISCLPNDIRNAGYELVEAFSQQRINTNKERNRKYYMVRYIFVHQEFLQKLPLSIEFDSFKKMCDRVMWRIRVYSNPFYQNNNEVPGHRTLSMNFEARKPLFSPDGRRINERKGNFLIPLRPDFLLWIINKSIKLIPYNEMWYYGVDS